MDELDFANDRDASLKLIDWFEIERVRDARVLVVGAGAIGNEVIKNLALIGIGNIFILDKDTIEASNLSRSILFRIANLTNTKAETAARAVVDINPSVRAYWCSGDLKAWLGEGLIREMDVVIGCLDNMEARFVINRLCRRSGVPWIDAGIGALGGQVDVYGTDGPCYECGLSEVDFGELGLRNPCGRREQELLRKGRIPTTPMIASVVAGVQVQECLKLLDPTRWVGRTLGGRQFAFDGALCRTGILGLPSREGCDAHFRVDDDQVLRVAGLGARSTVREVLEGTAIDGVVMLEFGLQPGPGGMGEDIALARSCGKCGSVLELCRPYRDVDQGDLACTTCGKQDFPWDSDFEFTNRATLSSPERLLDSTLAELNIPAGGWVAAYNSEGKSFYLQLAEQSGDAFTPVPLHSEMVAL